MPQITQYYIKVTGPNMPADPSYPDVVSPLHVVTVLNNAKFWDNDQAGRDAAIVTIQTAHPELDVIGGSRPKP